MNDLGSDLKIYDVKDLLSYILPMEIVRRVRVIHSHPVADLVRSEEGLKNRRHRSESTHGCPYDRGSADAYYYRVPNPHYWTNGNGRDRHTVYELTAEETAAYHLGYDHQHDRRCAIAST